jgi:hypothetical protein
VTGSDCLAASLTWNTMSNTNIEHHHRKHAGIIIQVVVIVIDAVP